MSKGGLSLRTKWTIASLVLALAPLAAAGVAVGSIQRDALASAERDLELAVVDSASLEIGHRVHDVETAAHRAALALADGRIDEEARLSLARVELASSEAVDWFSLFDAAGASIGALQRLGGPSPGVVEGVAFTDPHAHWNGLRFVEPLIADGRTTGWLVAQMRSDAFNQAVVDLSTARLGRSDHVFVVDRTLHVVAGEPESWPAGKDASHVELFQRVKLAPAAFARRLDAHASFTSANGAAMTGTVRVLPEQEWAVVVVRPEADAFAALAEAKRAFASIALAIAMCAVIAGMLLARRNTRPVQQLVELTRAYGRREFDAKIEVSSDDELGELSEALARMAHDLAEGEREILRRAAVESQLARYLPVEAAATIAKGGNALSLEGRRLDVSLLFADVASFTAFVERAPPERVVALLNELFTILSEIVFRHGGMVDKFIGDCVMAVFGMSENARSADVHHAEAALAAAEDMHRFVEASATRWREEYGVDVALGIGVASGETLVGNIGSERRLEFTAIGDAVNVAARLETLARPGQTLVTASVAGHVGTRFDLRSLGEHAVRGKSERVEILEVVT